MNQIEKIDKKIYYFITDEYFNINSINKIKQYHITTEKHLRVEINDGYIGKRIIEINIQDQPGWYYYISTDRNHHFFVFQLDAYEKTNHSNDNFKPLIMEVLEGFLNK